MMMGNLFDIFKIAKNGDPVWIEAAQSLEAATARVGALRESVPCDYVILSQRTKTQDFGDSGLPLSEKGSKNVCWFCWQGRQS